MNATAITASAAALVLTAAVCLLRFACQNCCARFIVFPLLSSHEACIVLLIVADRPLPRSLKCQDGLMSLFFQKRSALATAHPCRYTVPVVPVNSMAAVLVHASEPFLNVMVCVIVCSPASHPALLCHQSARRDAVFGKPPFSDAAAGDDSLVSTRTDHYGVDFRTTLYHDEVCDHRRSAVGEVDGEGPGAIGIHRVGNSGRGVGEIGDDLTIHRDRVDLGEPTLAIELSHRHAHLGARGPLATQFVALDGESKVASDEFVIASRRRTLRVSCPQSPEH